MGDKKPCEKFGDRIADMDEVLILKEANDNHIEEHTVGEFIEWCENGRTDKSGTWTSKGTGQYFAGGREAGGQMVDQRFLPRIDEGEARFVMIGKKLFRVEHYVYIGGVGGETKTTIYSATADDFPDTEELPLKKIQDKLESELDLYLKALGLGEADIPLLWAADFIPVDNHVTPMVIGEFNCSCQRAIGSSQSSVSTECLRPVGVATFQDNSLTCSFDARAKCVGIHGLLAWAVCARGHAGNPHHAVAARCASEFATPLGATVVRLAVPLGVGRL